MDTIIHTKDDEHVDDCLINKNKPFDLTPIIHLENTIQSVGTLYVSMAPGKQDKKSQRDLQSDLNVIKDNNINIIICLLGWNEMELLNIVDYPFQAQKMGFIFHHMPIRDKGIPRSCDLHILVPYIVRYLNQGKNVLIHCRCGLGRAGTISACCLIHFKYSGSKAIRTVRKQRPGAIHTREQQNCIIQYYKLMSY